MKCKKCGKQIVESERNRNIVMSPSKLCFHCERYENLKQGDWYQNSKGEYLQKQAPEVQE